MWEWAQGCLTDFLKVIKIITGKKFVRKCARSSGTFVNQKSTITTLIPQTLECTNEFVPIGSTVYFIKCVVILSKETYGTRVT